MANQPVSHDNSTDAQIAEQKKYFKLYTQLPIIIALSIFAFSLIAGIIVGITLQSVLFFILSAVPGSIIALFAYPIYKIKCSERILTVLYLQKLNEDK